MQRTPLSSTNKYLIQMLWFIKIFSNELLNNNFYLVFELIYVRITVKKYFTSGMRRKSISIATNACVRLDNVS